MAEEVTIPKIGKVKKSYVYAGTGIVAVYVGWRWYTANQASAADVTYTTPDVNGQDVSASGVIGGAASGNNQYAGTTTDGTNTGSIDTNAQWTADAVAKLTATGGWDSAAVYTALGDFLDHKPLTTTEQGIVRAAMAASGNPPVGGPYTIISTPGDITLPAPGGVAASTPGTTNITLKWNAVQGAREYYIYEQGSGNAIRGASSSTTGVISGLKPNQTYHISVAAVSTLGKIGTKSSYVTVKTTMQKLAKPSAPKISHITAFQATVSTNPVPNASGYAWYVNGVPHGHSVSPSYRLTALSHNTSYYVTVAADTVNQGPSEQSARTSFKTKAK